ncbi:MAG TPA: peptidoglycan bridge formation glycyltransferase FemA/FemB family protein [Anaerolineales bacterium]
MPEVSLNEWKEFIKAHAGAHVLQTAEWGGLKSAFGWQPVRLICEGAGAQVLFRKLPFGVTIAYVAKPVSDLISAESSPQLWQELVGLCKRQHAVFLKVEPDQWAPERDFRGGAEGPRTVMGLELRLSEFNIQPPRTLLVDLRGSDEDVLGRMKQKCRYNIRLAQKKDVTVRPWDDLDGFHKLMQVTGGRDGFGVHSAAYYRRAYELFRPDGNCELLVAEYAATPLAALMVFGHGKRAWYFYGASNDLERNRMPTYLLQWEAMRWAKSRGCEVYDLWGVPDEDLQRLEAGFETRHDGLWGVYRFKRGFGGELKRAAQALDLVFNSVLYRLYTLRMAGREAA